MQADWPRLEADRLILRPLEMTDARDVQRLAGDAAIAATTLNIPHPYEDGVAEQWIAKLKALYAQGNFWNFAITLRADGALIGAIALLDTDPRHERAELGYWVGKPFWGKGYCTEAADAMVRYGFETLQLNRIWAHHFHTNPASGRVMQKIGMTHEGRLRQHLKKNGVFIDSLCYGILRQEWIEQQKAG